MKNEWNSFLNASQAPGQGLSSRVRTAIQVALNPSPVVVFSKLMAIHLASAAVTLSLCPQFGFRLFFDGMGLMHYFMSFGTYGCMVACGAFFTGATLLAASLVLRPEEIRALRKHRLLELGALTLLSLGFFVMVDAELLFGLVAAWFLGCLIGGALSLELGWKVREAT